ncbi:MAG: helix-turn-helix domain-containing protein [Candidatus Bathyarchaeia archaeon]
MTQHKSPEYIIKQVLETERYLVVFFSTPSFGTWSVFIPRSEVTSIKDFPKIEEAIKRKIAELKRETKGIRWLVGVPLYESDMKVLLSLLLDGPCESAYKLSKTKKVAQSTCYDAFNRLLKNGFIKKAKQAEVTFLGFCAAIKEQVEHVLENRDEVIRNNANLLPLIFRHWDDFKGLEDLQDEIWNRVLEYVWFELEARLSLIQNRYPLLTLEEIEEILKNDLTRFIIFPWLHEFINDLLLFEYTKEEKEYNTHEVPEDVKMTVESWKKIAKNLKRKQIRKWITTLSEFDDIKEFISKELGLLEQLFRQTIGILKEYSF